MWAKRGVVRCVAIVTSKDGKHPICSIKNRECIGLHRKCNAEKKCISECETYSN